MSEIAPPESAGIRTGSIRTESANTGSIRTGSVRTGNGRTSTRRTLPPTLAFAAASFAFASLYLAAGAPTPLLVVLEERWGFPGGLLTIAFAAYAIALLIALLVAGSLSDHIGRRPVIIGALGLELVAMLMFVVAPDIGWVIAARVVQGLATGAATSAFTAYIVELAPAKYTKLGSIIGGTAAAGGLGLGALFTGIAVQLSSHANEVVFTVLTVVMALGVLAAVFSTETAAGRPGARSSLIPRVTIPHAARGEFAAAIPVHVASWMMAGLFMGLIPTIIRQIFHIDSGLLNGATAFLEPGAAAIAGFALGSLTGRRTVFIGNLGVLVGATVIVSGVAAGLLPLVWVGGLIGGVGFGASFSGSLRLVGPHAAPAERAGLFAGVFLVAYLAFGLPVIIAGQLMGPLGLLPTVIGYGVVILLVSLWGLLAQATVAKRSRATTGPAVASGRASS